VSSALPPRYARPDPLVGSVINGKYRVTALVAAGGMGKIFRAEQLSLERPVAIKVLHSHSTSHLDDPTFKKRFFREASILSRLQHPNIVTVFDYGAIDGTDERYFMAMEFLSGDTLLRRIVEQKSIGVRETVRIGKQIARGLSEAHALGIVHRDLKPSNVMLVAGRHGDELVKVLDFGIVKILGDEDSIEELTQEGSFIGSPKYMAPEQITRGAKVDARTDVYSLGIILYQCLCGAVPFDAESSIQTMMAHLNQAPLPMGERAPALVLPQWLDELVMACIAKEPHMRPATMELVARTLAEGENALVTGATISQPPRAAPARPSRPSVGASLSPSTAATNVSTETGPSIASLPPNSHDGDDRTRLSAQPRAASALLAARVTPIAIGGAVLLAAAAFVGVRATHVRGEASSPSAASRASSASSASNGSNASREMFRLVVESTPAGAEVIEADVVLGTTPLTLAIDNARARTQPRQLTLKLAGYQPYALTQGPSDDNVRILATLSPTPTSSIPPTAPLATLTPPNEAPLTPLTTAPSAHATRASAPGAHPARSTPAESAARKPDAPDPKLDIRLSR
jgi:serine/threonine protein kinase